MTLETENWVLETLHWLKRQSGNRKRKKHKSSAETVRRQNGEMGNTKQPKRTGQP